MFATRRVRAEVGERIVTSPEKLLTSILALPHPVGASGMSAPGYLSTLLAVIKTEPSVSMQSQPKAWKAASRQRPKIGTEIMNHDTSCEENKKHSA